MKKIDVLINAKEFYKKISGKVGMCYCFIQVTNDCKYNDGVNYETLLYNFPEFNPKYFKSQRLPNYLWWNVEDVESRLKAFDTLIELYKNNTEEFTKMTGKIKYSVTFYMFTRIECIICTRSYKSTLKYAFKYMWRRKRFGVFKIKRLQ